jgi:predicted transposase YdaD
MAQHHIHDRFFRSFFSDPRHLSAVLETALPPEVIEHLDLTMLSIEPGTWIDRHNREHLSDLAASVAIAEREPREQGAALDAGAQPEREERAAREEGADRHKPEAAPHASGASPATARVYILIEHKSWSDSAALLQLLRYMVQVWTAEQRAGATPQPALRCG